MGSTGVRGTDTLYPSIRYRSSAESFWKKHMRNSDSRLRALCSTSVEKKPGRRLRNAGVITDSASSLPSFVTSPTKWTALIASSP
jgi:hypothetical protein